MAEIRGLARSGPSGDPMIRADQNAAPGVVTEAASGRGAGWKWSVAPAPSSRAERGHWGETIRWPHPALRNPMQHGPRN